MQAIDDRLVAVRDGHCERQIIKMPPAGGQSQRISVWLPLWLLRGNLRIGIVSYVEDFACRFGRRIRDILREHPELGLTLSQSSQRQDESGSSATTACEGKL